MSEAPDRLHDLIHPVGPGLSNRRGLLPYGRCRYVRTGNQKTQGLARTQSVTGQLLSDELVVRPVFVESTNDVITVNPSKFTIKVGLRAIRLSPADNAPTNAEPNAPRSGATPSTRPPIQRRLLRNSSWNRPKTSARALRLGGKPVNTIEALSDQ